VWAAFALIGCAAAPAPPLPANVPADLDGGLALLRQFELAARIADARTVLPHLARLHGRSPRRAEIEAATARIDALAGREDEMRLAIAGMASDNARLAELGRLRVAAAGETGRAFLRGAVLDGTDRQAVAALAALVDAKDAPAVDVIVQRLRTADSRALQAILARALDVLAGPDDLRRLAPAAMALVGGDACFRHRATAGLLCRAYTNVCDRDAVRFNDMAGEHGAFGRVRQYVSGALESGDEEIAAWASEFSAAFGLMVPGLRGSYYEGVNFERLLHERLDAQIDVPDRKFAYPDSRQDNISVRWTGFVKIAAAGTYTFYSASDDGQRLWVGEKLLIDDWTYHAVVERSAKADLDVGVHPIKVEFMQGDGGASIRISYEGPGISKRVIPPEVLMTVPWN
jgi:hypothetical protein